MGLAVQQEGLLLVQCGRKENVDFKRFKAFLTAQKKISFVVVLHVHVCLMKWRQQWCISSYKTQKKKNRRLTSSTTMLLRLCVHLSVTMKTSMGTTSSTLPELQDLANARFWNVSIPRRVKNPRQTALLLNSRSQKLQTGPNNPRQEGHKAGFVAACMQSGLLADMRPKRIF